MPILNLPELTLRFSQAPIARAPAGYTRVKLTEGKERRLVREGATDTLELGVGKWAEVTRRRFLLICRDIVKLAKEQRATKLAWQVDQSPFPQLAAIPPPELAQLVAENVVMANYEYVPFKTPSEDSPSFVEELCVCGTTSSDMEKGFQKGKLIAEGVNACRTLANTPGADLTPVVLAEAAQDAAKGLPITVTVLGPKEMQELGMGAVLGVAKGSSEEPRFIVMEYEGKAEKPIVLVGKGVTFDSGGLDIKTDGHMYEMHMDMSGGAAVIASVVLAARLGLKRHVVGLVPAVENMSAGNAMRPGDILRSLSGKTVEVTNTDAEGRLILADALTYAKRFAPSAVLDAATLTGSSISALGVRTIAYFANDERLAASIGALAEESGEYAWRMPLWAEYEENVKGTFADLVNVPESKLMQKGDVVNAATFLAQFVKDLGAPWAHLDIAPRMTTIPADKLAAGAAGAPVRLFIRFIEQWNS